MALGNKPTGRYFGEIGPWRGGQVLCPAENHSTRPWARGSRRAGALTTGSHHDFPELSSAEFCHHLNVSPGVIRQPPTVICAGRWESQVVQGQLWLSEFIFSMEVAKRQELGIHSVLATSAVPYSDGSFLLQPQHRLPHHSGDMVNSFIPFQIQGF